MVCTYNNETDYRNKLQLISCFKQRDIKNNCAKNINIMDMFSLTMKAN